MASMNPYARELRKTATPPEKILWGHLRGRRLLNTKFRRQFPMGPYIVDFFCQEHLLIIEVDGAVHFETEEAIAYDCQRQNYLTALGYRMLRFTTNEIQKNLIQVLETIGHVVGTPHPALRATFSPREKGLNTEIDCTQFLLLGPSPKGLELVRDRSS